MADLDNLRPEVQEAVDRLLYHLAGTHNHNDLMTVRAELRRLVGIESELASLKARIAGSSVVKIANYGDPFIVLPDHLTVPNSLKGKTVYLLMKE